MLCEMAAPHATASLLQYPCQKSAAFCVCEFYPVHAYSSRRNDKVRWEGQCEGGNLSLLTVPTRGSEANGISATSRLVHSDLDWLQQTNSFNNSPHMANNLCV